MNATPSRNATPSKLLIIDDDEAVTQTFAKILRLEGHEVRTALDAESGLQQADILNPDAIIVDLRMPLINGLGFLYRLRERQGCQHTPVAIVTADYTLDESIPRELAELGAELHFKPLWLEDVVDLAHSLLGSEDGDRKRPRTSAH
jgi:DNA-binding response OmpR family regulator